MKPEQLFHLLARARQLCHHDDYVIMGSLSALGVAGDSPVPDDMTMSIDVNCYTRDDPGRVFDLVGALGETSDYFRETGIYLDPITPHLPTLPEGWQSRLIKIERDGVRGWFLDPNDATVSKYARGEPRDRRWIRAGIEAGIVSLPLVRVRFGMTDFFDAAERKAALTRLEDDAGWFATWRNARGTGRRRS